MTEDPLQIKKHLARNTFYKKKRLNMNNNTINRFIRVCRIILWKIQLRHQSDTN